MFSNAIDSLSDEDKKLPQVEHVLPLLKKGQIYAVWFLIIH